MHDEQMNKRSSRGWRFAWATWVAILLAICMVPGGCAATNEIVDAPSLPSEPTAERSIPGITGVALQNCVTEGFSRLSRHSYDLSFEVRVTAAGVVEGVDAKGSRLDDAGMETCMMQALEAMSVREFSTSDDLFQQTPQSVLPSSRALIGTAALLPQAIHLAPIVISAPGGITIVVGVAIIVAIAAVAVGSTSADCLEEWEKARNECLKQLDSNDPDYGVTGGYVNVKDCARGLVSMRCGGNRYDGDGHGAHPGRRT